MADVFAYDAAGSGALRLDATEIRVRRPRAGRSGPAAAGQNASRILREYCPKGVPITADPKFPAMVAAEINNRPRKLHA